MPSALPGVASAFVTDDDGTERRRCCSGRSPGPPVGSTAVGTPPPLDLEDDVLTLTRALVDIPSVSGDEDVLADAVEAALRGLGGRGVGGVGNAVLARTNLGKPGRVVLAGHLDTVPIADNVPSTLHDDR